MTIRWLGYRHQWRNVGYGQGFSGGKGIDTRCRITGLEGKGVGCGREQIG